MKNVLVGISYAVDSFVAKNLLKEKGFEVHECNLNINSDEFKKVKKHFVDAYIKGLTPNICTYCNRYFKFYELNKKREELGLDFYATGHYANVIYKDGRYAIKKSKNVSKDQSYMLYNLSQEELTHLILPISDMDKSEVRKLAAVYEADEKIKYSEKKDSLDICFIQNKSYVEYIKEYFLGNDYKEKIALGEIKKEDIDKYYFLRSGRIVIWENNAGLFGSAVGVSTTKSLSSERAHLLDVGVSLRARLSAVGVSLRARLSNVGVSLRARSKNDVVADTIRPHTLAYHDGIINFTVGQRLYIDGNKTDLYVKSIDKDTLDVVVCKKENLYVSEFDVGDINYMLLDDSAGSSSNRSAVGVSLRARSKNEVVADITNNVGANISTNVGADTIRPQVTANVKTTYRGEEVKCECIFKNKYEAHIKLFAPLIVSKGQAAVFYDDEGIILFGGTIL